VCGEIGLPGDEEEVETEFPARPGVALDRSDMFRLEKLRGDRGRGKEDASESSSLLALNLPTLDNPLWTLVSPS